MGHYALHNVNLEFKRQSDALLLLGDSVKGAVCSAIRSIANKDIDLARAVIAEKKKIATLATDVDSACFEFIVHYQPKDDLLKNTIAIIHMLAELRSIANISAQIAEVGLQLSSLPKPLVDIPRMGETVVKMVDVSLLAFARKDLALAYQVFAMDDMVDDLEKQIFRELFVMIMENPKIMERANQLMLVSRLLERAGEHAINLSERVVEMISGVQGARSERP